MKKVIILDETGDSDITQSISSSREYEVIKIITGDGANSINYLDDISGNSCDLVISVIWHKIIPAKLLKKTEMINIHGGILPFWRGLSSNCWAMINGDHEVGYSIHKIEKEIDSGEIYKIYKVSLKKNEHYGEAKIRLRNKICEDIPNLINDILHKKIIPEPQPIVQYSITPKIRPEYGKIDWSWKSKYLLGIFLTMSKPYGTGIYFTINEIRYDIIDMDLADNIRKYDCIEGIVLYKNSEGVIIKTGDSAILIKKLLTNEGHIVNPSDILKIGQIIS